MYSVSIRNSENVAVPRMNPPTFAPATVLVRRIPKRISGSACRRSHQPKAASSATDAAMTPIVRPEPQPYVPLWVIAYTSATSPPVTSTAPRASYDFTVVSRLSSRRRGARKKAATPTGTLTKKIHDQLSVSVSTPPSRTPAAAPKPPTAPQTPSAMLRSRPSVNVVEKIEDAAGEITAARSLRHERHEPAH